MLFALLAALAGLLIGSFLNACIFRLPRDITLWSPSRSICPECEAKIAWFDNIPLFSFFLLKGKCRKCQWRIPNRYWMVEILCGVMYFVIVYRFGVTALACKLLIFIAINVALIFTDLEERILPDEFTKGGVVLGIVIAWFVPLQPGFTTLVLPFSVSASVVSVAEATFAAAFGYGALWFVGWLYLRIRGREGMGMGDLKMVAMMGAFLGLAPTLFALMVGSILGSVVGLIYIRMRQEDAQSFELPFGSFLGLAAIGVAWMEALRMAGYPVVH